MAIVTELIDGFPIQNAIRRVQRDEQLLLTKPPPSAMKLWRDYDLLSVITFPTNYIPSKFAPPLGVYESDFVRIEWQKMNARQPFYHRNADVDEISYHLAGTRTLITEKGSVDLAVGDFARIPVNVAHDNRGVEDIHLLFYIPAPVTECVAPTRTTSYTVPPFQGWEPNSRITEMMTECLGAQGCDVAVSLTNEQMLLDAAKDDSDPIKVIRASGEGAGDTQWLYRSSLVWIGSTTLSNSSTKEIIYKRHRCADEIQYQVSGRRTLVSQRGTLELEAGDFVCIPLGTAFTDTVAGELESTHLSVLTRWPATPKREYSKTAEEMNREGVVNGKQE